jgi:hypothetical protein
MYLGGHGEDGGHLVRTATAGHHLWRHLSVVITDVIVFCDVAYYLSAGLYVDKVDDDQGPSSFDDI